MRSLRSQSGENVFAVAKKIRRDFDVAILFPNSLRVALEAWLAGIPRRVGYPGHRRRWLLESNLRGEEKKKKKKKPEPAPAPRHQVHHYLDLAEFVGAENQARKMRPPVRDDPPPQSSAPQAGDRGLHGGRIRPPAKRWLPERFAETMRIVHERTGCVWQMFGVEKDRPIADDGDLKAAADPLRGSRREDHARAIDAELRALRSAAHERYRRHAPRRVPGSAHGLHFRLDRAHADRSAGRGSHHPAPSRGVQPVFSARMPHRFPLYEGGRSGRGG